MDLRRVVIGIDFSAASVAAARWVAQHLAGDCELTLLHSIVVPTPPRFLRGRYPQLDTLGNLACEGARTRLEALAQHLPVKARAEVRCGKPVDAIIDVSRQAKADLIVIGRHGERGQLPGQIGTTAEAVARSASIPVLLAANLRDVRPRRILAALDDDATTSGVLTWAQALAVRCDACVSALHVIPNAALSHVLSTRSAATGQTVFSEAEIRHEFREDADAWLSRLVQAGCDPARVTSEIAFGDVASEIVGAAERTESEMIVLGSRRLAAPRRILGHVMREVIRRASAPVLMVPEPEE